MDLTKEVDQLVIRQKLKSGKPHACPFDSGFICDSPESLNCEVPVYGGEGHHTVLGFVLCPKYSIKKQ